MGAIKRLLSPLALLVILLCETNTVVAQSYQGIQLVQAETVANVNAVVPSEPFLVGVRLKMAPGWHTYWRYPGDAGIPTEIKWQLPPGWRAGEIQWPIPLKLTEPGDIQIYGYQNEVLLIQQITPPKNISGTTANFAAKVSWLVCEKICIPGDATVRLTLPVASTNTAANSDLFARFQKQLPRSPGANFSASWKKEASGLLLLTVSSPDLSRFSLVEFFPSPKESVAVGHPRLETRGPDQFTFPIPLDPSNRTIDSLPGLIVFGNSPDDPDRSAWDISAGPQITSGNNRSSLRELVRFLIFGFIGGFILNLMPCVLPVISLKIFGFVQQAGQSRSRIFRSGLAFIGGIFVWFIGLALVLVALKSAGREITWAFQFTNAYFVLLMSTVVLVFALNLFGVFEISVPQWLSRGAIASGSAHGDLGSFFQGVFATILATPCTAPFLGTALGFAFTQSAAIILLMFGAIAAGMSAPYFLLTAQPAWLKFLPRPGTWMVRVKELMGFLLIATLLFLLSVLGAQRGVSALIWASAFLLVVSIVCWIKGQFLVPSATFRARAIALVVMVALVLGGAAYFIGEKFQAASAVATGNALGNGWEKFTPDRLASEIRQGHPVFIDFTAEWCITCKFNESTVLETDAVRGAFSKRQIVKLKADWTSGDPAITKMLKQFGRPGVPLYVLYPGGSAQPYVFPELLTKNIVLENLETINHTIAYQP